MPRKTGVRGGSDVRTVPRFNEAAAHAAENPRVAREQAFEKTLASMRPRPMPRKTCPRTRRSPSRSPGFNEAAAHAAENRGDTAWPAAEAAPPLQ